MQLKTFGTLFSGVGGSDLGLSKSGLMPLYATDWNKKALQIHRANQNTDYCQYIHADINDLNFKLLPSVDVLWASPTCCNFSMAKHDRTEESEDVKFSSCIVEAARTSQVVIIENVVGYANSNSYALLANMLSCVGYRDVQRHILNASDYGNPAHRTRFYAIFSRAPLPVLDFTKYLKQTNWFDAILDNRHLWEQKDLTTVQKRTIDKSVLTEPYAIERCGYYGTPKIIPDTAKFPCIKSHTGHDGKNPKEGEGKIGSYRLAWNFVHGGESYAITPAMLGVLNGFPEDWDWLDNKGQAVAGSGNCVIPRMSEIISMEIQNAN